MQQFTVTLTVTVNTAATVSETEVRKAVEELVEDFDSGNIEVENVAEQ